MSVTWNSLGIEVYISSCIQSISKLENLLRKANDLLENRLEKPLRVRLSVFEQQAYFFLFLTAFLNKIDFRFILCTLTNSENSSDTIFPCSNVNLLEYSRFSRSARRELRKIRARYRNTQSSNGNCNKGFGSITDQGIY